MKNIKSILLSFFLFVGFAPLFSNETLKELNNTENENDICINVVSGLESWIQGIILGESTLMTYFNISQGEFSTFTQNNNIESLKIDFYWQSNLGDEINFIESEILTINDNSFNVENWTISIENAELVLGEYKVRITVDNEECGQLIPIPIVDDRVIPIEPDNPIDLPDFSCGETFTPTSITNQTSILSLLPGDILNIGGFPLLANQIQVQQNGTFSGEGTIPLPFTNKIVKVSFTNIGINTDFQVFSGTVRAISDDITNYPDFSVDDAPLNIGGDICIPPDQIPGYDQDGLNETTGLDPWGFDGNNVHSETGTPFDPNGFNVTGTHANGTPYNECGCNRESLTSEGAPCDPSCGPNPESETFATEIAPTLVTTVPELIDKLIIELDLNLNNLNCKEIRTELNSLVTTLQYDRKFIFGEDDKYFRENMHLEFSEEPKPLILNIDRDPNAKLLEEQHIDLYKCDKSAYAANAYKTALNNLNIDDLIAEILEEIKSWTEYQLNLFSDPDKFEEWVTKELGERMKENSGLDDSYGRMEQTPSEINLNKAKKQLESIFKIDRGGYYNSIANLDNNVISSQKMNLDETSFHFRQGAQSIQGIDRAFFIEELAKQQYLLPTESTENLLPIKVEKTVGNMNYIIYLDNIGFSTNGAVLDAYLIIEDPETSKKLVFKALNIAFGPTGLQGESALFMETDLEIRLNNAAMLILKGSSNTFVEWDCDGFAGMRIDAEIEFCRNFIVPLDGNLNPIADTEQRYKLPIVTGIPSWLEFQFEISQAPPFSVAQHEDIKWQLTNLFVDFSSSSTPAFQPMDGYSSPYWDGFQMSPLWKGFYMQNLKATFPNSFSNTETPIIAQAQDILIDGGGFTGGVSVENLVPFEEGNMGGWPFSIDGFQLRLLKNQFAGGGLNGEINVPIMEERMGYEAVVYPGNEYRFTVSPVENATLPLFLANANIYPESRVEVGYRNNNFEAVATLTGTLSINSELANANAVKLELPQLAFQNFQVSNGANDLAYFSAGTWGLVDTNQNPNQDNNFKGFKLRISEILPYQPAAEEGVDLAGLRLSLDILLSNSIDVNAGGDFGIIGELVHVNNRQKWKFKKIKIGSLNIDASFPGVKKLVGVLDWYGNDGIPNATYGEGFRGLLDVDFDFIDIGLKATAQFGKKDDFKYFFVDALADIGALNIGTGFLKIKGFGGGVSNNMDIQQGAINFGATTSGGSNLPPIGTSFSGTVYTPDQSKGLGLKAAAVITTARDEIFNGTVSLQFLFNDNFGLDKISLQGAGQFLEGLNLEIDPEFPGEDLFASVSSPPTTVAANLSAYIDLSFNFNEPSFDGTLAAFLNAGPLQGAGSGGKLVNAELHFGPDSWYIYMGTPTDKCGIVFDLPMVGGFSSTGYIDVGSVVPPMAPLPNNVQQIAYKVNKNETLRSSGAGFVFGAALKFDMAIGAEGIVQGSVEAEAGFDVMLRKYKDLHCIGSTDPVGINGWYGSGQMWAYVQGNIQVFGVKVLEAGIAAVLQARLPKPFWAQATVGVKVKLLFVNVKKSIKLELGSDCVLASDEPIDELGMQVITYLEPIDGADFVETNAIPTAHLGIEIEKEYEIETTNGGAPAIFKTQVKAIKLLANGYELAHSVSTEDPMKVVVTPLNMLPGDSEITFIIKMQVFKNGAPLTYESDTTIFVTGPSLEIIPESNIAASYPITGMTNFYKEEYNLNEGFIELNVGQPDLMYNIPRNINQVIRLTGSNGDETYLDYEYDGINNKITFPLDPSLFNNDQLYKLELVRRHKGLSISHIGVPTTGGSGSANRSQPTLLSNNTQNNNYTLAAGDILPIALSGGNDTSPPSAGTNNLDEVGTPTETVLYSIVFRVSKYNTLGNKLDAIMAQNSPTDFTKDLAAYEGFDELEIYGNDKYPKLLSINTSLNNPYMAILDPLLYDHLPTSFTYTVTDGPGGIVPINYINEGVTTPDKSLLILGDTPSTLGLEDFENGYSTSSNQELSFQLEEVVERNLQIARTDLIDCYQEFSPIFLEEFCFEIEANGGQIKFNCSCGSGSGNNNEPIEINYEKVTNHRVWCEIGEVLGDDVVDNIMKTHINSNMPVMPSGTYPNTFTYSLSNGTTITNKTIEFVK